MNNVRKNWRWWFLGTILVLLYSPMLAGRIPAFRDAYHFYYPLQVWLDHQAALGDWFPQYCPYDGSGISLLGEGSSALCYPLRVIWWIPLLDVAQRMGLYLLLHTILAAAGGAYAARRAGLDKDAALLAAGSYALAGPVIFQHSNPIYLVGAAWAPWALAECWTIAYRKPQNNWNEQLHTRWWLWILSASMMLLGGDPQSTVHVGILTLVAIVHAAWQGRSPKLLGRLLLANCLAVSCVVGLTAAQWLPTWVWLDQSNRVSQHYVRATAADSDAPRGSVAETTHSVSRPPEHLPQLIADFAATTSHEMNSSAAKNTGRYDFSIAPWNAITLAWGGVAGHYLPTHTRLFAKFNAEPKLWTASLSVSVVALCLVGAIACERTLRWRLTYLWWTTFVAATAMLGNYAPMWVIRNICMWFGFDALAGQLPADEIGGMYWLLTELLPGYSAFRYPAKWTIWFALCLSLLAAHALEQWPVIKLRTAQLSCGLAVLSLLLLSALLLASLLLGSRAGVVDAMGTSTIEPWFGSLDTEAVWINLCLSMSLTLACCWLAILSIRLPSSKQRVVMAVIAILELAILSRRWLITVEPPRGRTGAVLLSAPKANPGNLYHNEVDQNVLWSSAGQGNVQIDLATEMGSTDRTESLANYQQAFALGKLHLIEKGQCQFTALVSIVPRPLAALRRHLLRFDSLEPDDPDLEQALLWLGINQRVVRDSGIRIKQFAPSQAVVDWQTSQQIQSKNQAYHTDTDISNQSRKLKVIRLSNDRIELEVQSPQTSPILIRRFQDGGWKARLANLDNPKQTQTIVPERTQFELYQSLTIEPGRWRVTLSYQAPGGYVGRWITLATLLISAVVMGSKCRGPNENGIAIENRGRNSAVGAGL